MSKFLSEQYQNLEVYTPGEQPVDFSKFIKLNTNELPYPPTKRVVEAASREAAKLNLYPPLESASLKEKLAALYGVKSENIFLANGSDEILSFSFLAYCSNGRKAAFADITYGFYKVYARLYGTDAKIIPLTENFDIDPADYSGIGRTIFIANPNAPTGKFLPVSQIEQILKSNPENIVVVDEAYVDFGGESAAPLIEQYDNLLVVQTFSKSRSLAGGRLGFAISSPAVIADLNKIKYSTNPYHINRMTYAAGEAAIDDQAYYTDCCAKIIATRDRLTAALKGIGFTVLDSRANFIFAKPCGITAKALYLQLKENGILIRYFEQDRIKDYVRISIGTDGQTDALIKEIG